MKTFLKVVGWIALVSAAVWGVYQLTPENQRVAAILACGFWFFWALSEWLKQFADRVYASQERIERQLKLLEDQPLNTRYVVDGLESIIDEHNKRHRAEPDSEPSITTLTGDWPFKR